MPKNEYDWQPGRPAILKPHSKAKHQILRRYVEEYIRILTTGGGIPRLKLTLVDGFAGGGEYTIRGQGSQIHDGSPFILLTAVETALVKINSQRKKPIDSEIDFIFIEKKKSNCDYLKDALDRRRGTLQLAGRSRIVQGDFTDQLDSIINEIRTKRHRSIFILDQYGYTAIPVSMIAKIMSALPSAEIFMTIAVDSIQAYARSTQEALLTAQRALFPELSADLVNMLNGTKEIEALSEAPEQDRNAAMFLLQRMLHSTFAAGSHAKYYTPFFIRSDESHRSYWFLHLANNPRANDVVKQLHWDMSNYFSHYGLPGTNMLMLGHDPARPPREQLGFHDFGISARERTTKALLESLPEMLSQRPGETVFDDLYAILGNDTPASKNVLREPIGILCREGVLEKTGAKGEERRLETPVRNTDRIILAKQMPLFSFPKMKK